MASNFWEEVDSNVYIPACLESYTEPVQDRVYIMYHGTTKENAEKIRKEGFKASTKGMLGKGVYVSRDIQKAGRYPLDIDESQRYVLKILVNVGRVKKIDKQKHPMQKTWHDKGYDTAWVPPNCGMVPSGLEEDCVWDPRRIRVMEVMHPSSVLQIIHILFLPVFYYCESEPSFMC
uniref:PARP catalytic domain-containing protein n=1 Tax=Erpetoichthys calabaricus TaxID=27687 RepID=A0A8C4RFZ4_ERPCA